MIKIAPSILAADFGNLLADVNDIQKGGADYLHFDVMDGVFVPNISIGIPVLQSLRSESNMFMDVHLMITKPHRYVEEFCRKGADLVVFHVEADEPQDILKAIETIKACGKKVGLALKPKTPASIVFPYIEILDLVLVMTVEPGFGGQSFMADMLPKIAEIRAVINEKHLDCELEVDGGIAKDTAKLVIDAGANVLVAGSAVFKEQDRQAIIEKIRNPQE